MVTRAGMNKAINDLVEGVRRHDVWIALAREDIGDQHRRTMLGPLWLLVNYFLFVATFVFIFTPSGKDNNHIGYVAVGLLVWFFMSEVITISVTGFTREENLIKGTTLPLTVYVMRIFMQSVIRAGYAVLGCAAILFFSGTTMDSVAFSAIIGLFLILLITPAVIIILAFIGAYFLDMQFVVNNVMRVGLFITPVLWNDQFGDNLQRFVATWNPFTYFINIVRDPLVGGTFPANSLLICCAIGVLVWLAAFVLLQRLRDNVVFVL